MTEKSWPNRISCLNRELTTALSVAGSILQHGNLVAKYDKAKIIYLQLLAKSPDDIVALNNLALLLAEYTSPGPPD